MRRRGFSVVLPRTGSNPVAHPEAGDFSGGVYALSAEAPIDQC